jgi:hypothetical protein
MGGLYSGGGRASNSFSRFDVSPVGWPCPICDEKNLRPDRIKRKRRKRSGLGFMGGGEGGLRAWVGGCWRGSVPSYETARRRPGSASSRCRSRPWRRAGGSQRFAKRGSREKAVESVEQKVDFWSYLVVYWCGTPIHTEVGLRLSRIVLGFYENVSLWFLGTYWISVPCVFERL